MANQNALTTVAAVKDHLGIPAGDQAQDGRLERFINTASDRISNYCERQLVAGDTVDILHGGMTNMVMLQEWPINSISEVAIDSEGVFGPDTVIQPENYRMVDEGTLLYNTIFPYGYGNVRVTYNAGYQTIPSDLEMAAILLVEWLHRFRSNQNIGRSALSKGDESVTILQDIPPIIRSLLDPYRRTEFSVPDRPARNV